jgi:hypothetical protein
LEVSGQLHAPVALALGKEPLVPIGWEVAFQQENAIVHNADKFMTAIYVVFVSRTVRIDSGLLSLLILGNCDYYLCSGLKGNLYNNNPCTTEALQNEITGAVAPVSRDELQKVFELLYVLGSMLEEK